jgi:hypothetical protein
MCVCCLSYLIEARAAFWLGGEQRRGGPAAQASKQHLHRHHHDPPILSRPPARASPSPSRRQPKKPASDRPPVACRRARHHDDCWACEPCATACRLSCQRPSSRLFAAHNACDHLGVTLSLTAASRFASDLLLPLAHPSSRRPFLVPTKSPSLPPLTHNPDARLGFFRHTSSHSSCISSKWS